MQFDRPTLHLLDPTPEEGRLSYSSFVSFAREMDPFLSDVSLRSAYADLPLFPTRVDYVEAAQHASRSDKARLAAATVKEEGIQRRGRPPPSLSPPVYQRREEGE